MKRHLIALLLLFISTPALSQDDSPEAYFKKYLNDCKAHEIRCLYFLQDQPSVSMIMTFDLHTASVYTAREVYNWATQSSENRQISHYQTETLKQLCQNLPVSETKLLFRQSLFIATHMEDGVHIYQYERQKPPSVVQRIYDIGGGYLEP